MTEPPTDDDEEDSTLTDPETDFPIGQLGAATGTIDVDAATYEELAERWDELVADGYDGSFTTFAMNYLDVDWTVTVDGEPITTPSEEATGDE